jgi:hypothetical protein
MISEDVTIVSGIKLIGVEEVGHVSIQSAVEDEAVVLRNGSIPLIDITLSLELSACREAHVDYLLAHRVRVGLRSIRTNRLAGLLVKDALVRLTQIADGNLARLRDLAGNLLVLGFLDSVPLSATLDLLRATRSILIVRVHQLVLSLEHFSVGSVLGTDRSRLGVPHASSNDSYRLLA